MSLINFEGLQEEKEVSWDQLCKGQGYTGKSYNSFTPAQFHSGSVSLDDVAELSDRNAILCNGCKRLLDTISKLKVKLQTLQGQVVEMLQGLPVALVQR